MKGLIGAGLVALVLAGCGSTQPKPAKPHAAKLSAAKAAQQAAANELGSAAATANATTSPVSAVPALPCAEATSLPSAKNCTLNGTTLHLAHGHAPLRLPTLTAKILATRTTSSVTNGPGFTSLANGRYLVVSLRITNRMNSPQTFGPPGASQTVLEVGGAAYSEAFKAENGNDGQSFVTQNTAIEPGESETGDVIYDLPPGRASHVTADANNVLLVGNFGDDLSTAIPARAGLISLVGA